MNKIENKIENLDIVTLKNGNKYLYVEHPYWGKVLINKDGEHLSFDNYDEDYRVKRDMENFPWDNPYDISKINRTMKISKVLDIDNSVNVEIFDASRDFKYPDSIKDFLKEFPTYEDYKTKGREAC